MGWWQRSTVVKKQKTMEKVKGIYQAFIMISIVFFMVASYICLVSLKAEDTTKVLGIGYAVEVIVIFCGIYAINNGAAEILKETHRYSLQRKLYQRILEPCGFGFTYSLIIICLPYGFFNIGEDQPDAILIYALNIASVSLMFVIWMWIRIRKIRDIEWC